MKYAAITFDGVSVDGEGIFSALDLKLQTALGTDVESISVTLNPEMPGGGDLLDWLEKWQATCSSQKKNLVIAPSTKEQLECLELSHPDQALCYVASSEELEKMFPPHLREPVPEERNEEPPQEKPSAGGPPAAAPAKEPEPKQRDPFDLYPEIPSVDTVTEVVPQTQHIHSTVEISGEYVCLSCGYKRMWLKGDTVTACENAECLNPEAGWQLTGDIF
jgi:hypothetical protein